MAKDAEGRQSAVISSTRIKRPCGTHRSFQRLPGTSYRATFIASPPSSLLRPSDYRGQARPDCLTLEANSCTPGSEPLPVDACARTRDFGGQGGVVVFELLSYALPIR